MRAPLCEPALGLGWIAPPGALATRGRQRSIGWPWSRVGIRCAVLSRRAGGRMPERVARSEAEPWMAELSGRRATDPNPAPRPPDQLMPRAPPDHPRRAAPVS